MIRGVALVDPSEMHNHFKPPVAQHFVDCSIVPGHSVVYMSSKKVSLWGTLRIKFCRDPDSNVIKSVYEVDVDKADPM